MDINIAFSFVFVKVLVSFFFGEIGNETFFVVEIVNPSENVIFVKTFLVFIIEICLTDLFQQNPKLLHLMKCKQNSLHQHSPAKNDLNQIQMHL